MKQKQGPHTHAVFRGAVGIALEMEMDHDSGHPQSPSPSDRLVMYDSFDGDCPAESSPVFHTSPVSPVAPITASPVSVDEHRGICTNTVVDGAAKGWPGLGMWD